MNKQHLITNIKDATSEEKRNKVKELSEKLKKENGASKAAETIVQLHKLKRHFGVDCEWEDGKNVSNCPTCSGKFLLIDLFVTQKYYFAIIVEFGFFTKKIHCRAW